MTMTNRIQTGSVEPLATFAVNNAGAPITGLANLHFRLRRFSDGFWFDFSDSTFKTNASVVTLDSAALTEVDATDGRGLYELASGFDFSSITNPTAGPTTEENYFIIPVQVGASNANLPAPGEVREGGFIDRIDATLSDIETDTSDIQSRLPAALVGGRIDSDVGAMQANTVTAAAIATDAIDADALATSGVNEIRDSIISDATTFQGADIAATLADTADMQPKLGTPVVSISADIAAVKVDTAATLVDTAAIDARLPTDPADESLQQASHTQTQADIAAINDTQVAVSTTAAVGSSATEIRTGLTQADNFFNGMLVQVENTAGVAVRRINEYRNINGAIFVDEPLPFTPAISDVVRILTWHDDSFGSIG